MLNKLHSSGNTSRFHWLVLLRPSNWETLTMGNGLSDKSQHRYNTVVFQGLCETTKSSFEMYANITFSRHLLSQRSTWIVTYQVHFDRCMVFTHFCLCVSQGHTDTYPNNTTGIITKRSSTRNTNQEWEIQVASTWNTKIKTNNDFSRSVMLPQCIRVLRCFSTTQWHVFFISL